MRKLQHLKHGHLLLGWLLALALSVWINASGKLVNVLQDDYFYYHVVATRLLDGQGSTYLPGVPTNGYQPLWQGVITVALQLSRWMGWDALRTSHLTSVLVGYAALALVWWRGRREPAALWLAWPALVACVFYFANMGMEAVAIVLAYALYAPLLNAPGQRPVLTGAMLFVCFMARIDSVLYIAPLTALLYRHHPARLMWLLGTFGLLAAAYGGLNWLWFGVPVPISGLAKGATVMRLHGITFETLVSSHSNQLIMVLSLVATWALAARHPAQRPVWAASGVLVLVFYVVHALRSDYGIWGWYLYPFALHLITLIVVRRRQAPAWASAPSPRVPLLPLGLGLAGMALMLGWHTWVLAIQAKDHPLVSAGRMVAAIVQQERIQRMAMGDRAGVVGYLSGIPLLQLEGLVMDKAYLQHIARKTPLMSLLQHHKVALYVASNPLPSARPGCYGVTEPSQATDKQARHEVCAPVLGRHTSASGHQTVVFDLRPAWAGQAQGAHSEGRD